MAASGGEEAMDLVASTLQDPDRGVRVRAAEALADIGGPEAASHIVAQLLHERELTARREIAQAATSPS